MNRYDDAAIDAATALNTAFTRAARCCQPHLRSAARLVLADHIQAVNYYSHALTGFADAVTAWLTAYFAEYGARTDDSTVTAAAQAGTQLTEAAAAFNDSRRALYDNVHDLILSESPHGGITRGTPRFLVSACSKTPASARALKTCRFRGMTVAGHYRLAEQAGPATATLGPFMEQEAVLLAAAYEAAGIPGAAEQATAPAAIAARHAGCADRHLLAFRSHLAFRAARTGIRVL